MKYTVVKELRSTAKYNKYIEIKDLMFVIMYFVMCYMFRIYVYSSLSFAYYVFSIGCALFLVMKTPSNPERKNYQRIMIMLRKNSVIYKPVKNNSKASKGM